MTAKQKIAIVKALINSVEEIGDEVTLEAIKLFVTESMAQLQTKEAPVAKVEENSNGPLTDPLGEPFTTDSKSGFSFTKEEADSL